ncbi:MAG: hypothetical protein QOJ15_11076, partial [Bradyrhizobium sp.]|nr:hypothetical protein [Bradyrhizobium sp.]
MISDYELAMASAMLGDASFSPLEAAIALLRSVFRDVLLRREA